MDGPGLTRKRFAFVTKTHHALVDGVSGVDIATVLFDVKPVPEPAQPDHDWVPGPTPSAAQLLAKDAEGIARAPIGLLRRFEHAVERPREALHKVSETVEALGEVGWNFANPAPQVPLNVPVGSHRRFEWVRADLDQFKRIKSTLGGTVNDVVLAVVTGALRRWLHSRGVRTEGMELRAQFRSRFAGRTSAASSATSSSPCAARSRSTSRIP